MLAQVAGCNRTHDATSRLVRWLLMIQGRTAENVLALTQQFLAQMIGSQRTTVGGVAGSLQLCGLAECASGSIRITDRMALRARVASATRLQRRCCKQYIRSLGKRFSTSPQSDQQGRYCYLSTYRQAAQLPQKVLMSSTSYCCKR
jgi:hypothetical protein